MKIFTKISEVSNHSNSLKSQGKRIAFVPTMGALHKGHLSLIKLAKSKADYVIASIFVNPAQFAPHEDFNKYPRSIEKDTELLKNTGCDAVFIPSEKEIYPQGKPEAKNIVPEEMANILCGKTRPHFFHGVWIVVKRLFEIVKPDIAVFGEKDFQQLQIIRKMVDKEGLNVEIIGAPIVREVDGLAMSSRNKYLNEKERHIAAEIFNQMNYIKDNVNNEDSDILLTNARTALLEAGFDSVDYIEVRDGATLQTLHEPQKGERVFVAATIGKTRLIDNIELN